MIQIVNRAVLSTLAISHDLRHDVPERLSLAKRGGGVSNDDNESELALWTSKCTVHGHLDIASRFVNSTKDIVKDVDVKEGRTVVLGLRMRNRFYAFF